MSKLKLSMVLSNNERTRPIADGSVTVQGVELVVTTVHPSEMFWRQLKFQEFDISEMSLSTFLIMREQGDNTWAGLPIFTTRKFFHTGILVRKDAGILEPADLRGKRVGVAEYQQTAALWSRGVLRHEFGVMPEDMDWYMERTEEVSHGGATKFEPPAGVSFHRIPVEKTIASMLISGELDAALNYLNDNNLVDRSRGTDVRKHPMVTTLFPDPEAEGIRYFEKTGIFPINHCVVIKRTVLEQNPWLALNLYNSFRIAKETVIERTRELTEVYSSIGWLSQDGKQKMRMDPFPYGVASNRSLLEKITQYSHEQGLTKRRLSLEEIFTKSTLDL
ncbi:MULTISPECIES: PhnD/SsuA/transferrin family substrate-binding protein [unclassified Paenibacillus]|uniref:PhnD/SsuA/transferrin family substrate-binding protein n=1 Tax=unclassified Paenibacillus TaxID=185978 RepID=UPI001AE94FC0|nr:MULTISPECIES: PhnD/SsuA/transferrin family substrate-binding protein [unclassified Paenibacillus]MBP1155404.1 4,5-dihydroxyphthalate decarboxylase [Paenibacillus sp. PvP091]MBP1169211.1 4,5-dihydroxyphthalate decarboxylase [Paenibacillus sp. PvR098]MBP2440239.1 4,5-dihydroxyphthalate decarboxylase [Paenibacillus sp. PvP052]